MSEVTTSYLRTVFNPEVFPITIAKTLETAKLLWKEYGFDTIAFCGVSGAAMAFVLAHEMRIPLLCVRKRGENSHFDDGDRRHLEGNTGVKKYLIVDDFISSGRTVNYIMDTIHQDIPNAECVAMLMYSGLGEYDYKYKRHFDNKPAEEWRVLQPRSKDNGY